jgi:hypothetical protein
MARSGRTEKSFKLLPLELLLPSCIYVCTYLRIYVCTYVRIYICMYICEDLCMYICEDLHMYVHMWGFLYVNMWWFMYVHMWGFMYVQGVITSALELDWRHWCGKPLHKNIHAFKHLGLVGVPRWTAWKGPLKKQTLGKATNTWAVAHVNVE